MTMTAAVEPIGDKELALAVHWSPCYHTTHLIDGGMNQENAPGLRKE